MNLHMAESNTKEDENNMITLKEINSNKEPHAKKELLKLLSNETTFLQ